MARKVIKEKYLRFTEETNAFDYLERAGEFIKTSSSDQWYSSVPHLI